MPFLPLAQAEKSPDGHSRDEMAIAVALSSPSLIRMLGVLETPLGLVMELVQGKALADKPNHQVCGVGDVRVRGETQ